MERHILSKSTFIRGIQCYKSLYLNKKHPYLRDKLPNARRAIFKRGSDIGVLARQLFPNGIDLSPKSASQFQKKALETSKIIRTDSFNTVYEAVFQYDKSLAILDILVKGMESWKAYEVKSSAEISETYLLDAAFQYYVITNSGGDLEDFFLVYINKDYVFDGSLDLEKLFIKQSVLSEIIERQEFIQEKVKAEKQILLGTVVPEINIGLWCHSPYNCDFTGHCWQNVKENSILYLDSLDENKRFTAYYSGNDDPDKFQLNQHSDKQRVQLLSAKSKKCFVDEEKLHQMVGGLEEDAVIFIPYFVRPAVPYLIDTHPYQAIPVAFGIQTLTGSLEITFLIHEKSAIELFISYFRNILKKYSKLIIYNKFELTNFLKEINQTDVVEEVEGKLVELSSVFQTDALFDYRLKGDYSPQNVSRIFLGKRRPLLDPSLLNMNWQIALLNGETEEKLLEDTKQFMSYLADFQYDFMNLLKNPKSIILLLNK